MGGYVVTAPLVQVRKTGGSYAHVYAGGALPDDADPEHVAMLVDSGMVAAGPGPARAREPGSDDAGEGQDDAGDEMPAGNASQEKWAAYAVAHGMPEDEAASLSRNDLRDRFQ